MSRFPTALLAIMVLVSASLAQSVCDPDWSDAWTGGQAIGLRSFGHGRCYALEAFDDGSGPALYMGGWFIETGGLPITYVSRWDGEHWSNLDSGASDQVNALGVFDAGSGPQLFMGGRFTSPATALASWDGAGWSGVGGAFGAFADVRAMALYDDGSGVALYVGGSFSVAGGVPASNIARWDGSSWSALDVGVNGQVLALAVYDDGSGPQLVAGGKFASAGGSPAASLASWDGTGWSPLAAGLTSPGEIRALQVFDGGSGPTLFAGGIISQVGGQPASGIASWDGASWSAVGSGANGVVDDLDLFDGGSGTALVAAGGFSSIGGVTTRVGLWDGSTWSALGSSMEAGSLFALEVFDDGGGPALFAAGRAQTGTAGVKSGLMRWNGTDWTQVGRGANGTVRAVETFDDGSGSAVYAGGDFTSIGEVGTERLARWDSQAWAEVGGGADDIVRSLAVFDDGGGEALFVGGSFTTVGGMNAGRIARWDGSGWSDVGGGVSGTSGVVGVYSLTVFDDGSGPALYAGGRFESAGGVQADAIARWDGVSWTNLAAGFPFSSHVVHALLVHDDGGGSALYAAGTFTFTGSTSARRVARWDGNSWSALGAGVGDTVFALEAYDEGSGPVLFAGGRFSTAAGTTALGIARWDGNAWSPVGAGLGILTTPVRALCTFDDSTGPRLFAGGAFEMSGSIVVNGTAAWDGNSWRALGSGTTPYSSPFSYAGVHGVHVLHTDASFGPERLWVGGAFRTAGSLSAGNLSTWGSACIPPTTFCTPKLSSAGCLPAMASSGSPSATDPNPFLITASQVINANFGILIYGGSGGASIPFQNGTLCVNPPVTRTPAQLSGGNPPPPLDCSGSFSFDFNAWVQAGSDPSLAPGSDVHAQYWFRDPLDTFGSGLSNGLAFTLGS